MSKFFPPALTLERKEEIIVYKQGDDESLYNAWEGYKRLLKNLPNAWNRFDHPDGHLLPLYELHLQKYN